MKALLDEDERRQRLEANAASIRAFAHTNERAMLEVPWTS